MWNKNLSFYFSFLRQEKNSNNKKVLLCEHKRHTARHIASTHFADWWGYPIQSFLILDGVPPSVEWGTAWSRPGMGTSPPIPRMGYLPTQTWDGFHTQIQDRVPPPRCGMGYPPPKPGTGYPPYLGWGIPAQTCDGVPPPRPGMGYPPPRPEMGYPHQW